VPDAAGRTIDTREELIAALKLAAELEHSLLVQYLFAAMSCRNEPSPAALAAHGVLAWRSLDVVRAIQKELYAIGREEMAHLATVSNLLASIGAAPHLTRPPMEEIQARLYSQQSRRPISFSLERMGPNSLNRFKQFEEPEPPAPTPPAAPAKPTKVPARAAPDTFDYRSVGGLYRLIAEGFEILYKRLGPSLFIGAGALQDRWHWDAGLRVSPVSDIFSARAAIEFIIAEGEGSDPSARTASEPPSHYERIDGMTRRFERVSRRIPLDMHVWPVIADPATHPTRAVNRQIRQLSPASIEFQCAELCNAIYTCMLRLLAQFYDPAGESSDARLMLAHSAKQTMSGILRPVCEMLVQLPAAGHGGDHAGPPFELYDDIRLPARVGERKTLLLERVDHLGKVCREFPQQHPALARLPYIAENIKYLHGKLAKALPSA
jgi:hypothetical protein